MTRKLTSRAPDAPAKNDQRHNVSPDPECDEHRLADSDPYTGGITLPATFHWKLDPRSTDGSEIRNAMDAFHSATSRAADPIARFVPEELPVAGLPISGPTFTWGADPTLDSDADTSTAERPIPECNSVAAGKLRKHARCHQSPISRAGEPKALQHQEDIQQHNRDKLPVPVERSYTCASSDCKDESTGVPKSFQRQEHKTRHMTTVHGHGDHNCYCHGKSTAKHSLDCPNWARTLTHWTRSTPPFTFPTSTLRHHTIPAGHGFALTLKPGAHLRIIDLHGQQVVDFMAWTLPFSSDNSCEHFSASYTRYRLGGSAPPQVGECLYSNRDRPMFEILEDKVKCHDMLFMACNPSFYARLGKKEHRSCASNVAEAMFKLKMPLVHGKVGAEGWSGVHDPFNVFQNTPYYSLKALECSREGDWIEMRASEEMKEGVVVGLSSCPYEEHGFNGGMVTDVGVVWEEL